MPPLPPGLLLAEDGIHTYVDYNALASARIRPGQPINEAAGASNQQFNKKEFIQHTVQHSGAQMKIAQLGVEKAQDPALKEAAKELLTKYSKINGQAKDLAAKKQIVLSEKSDSQHLDHLTGLSGEEFDKAFATLMNQGQEMEIASFKKGGAQSQDAEICAFAEKGLTALQQNSTLIQEIAAEKVGGTQINEAAGAQIPEKPETSSSEYKTPAQNQDGSVKSEIPK
jgi:putative membrane protein